ncbi:uncharacterized protein B0T23DRAFT_370036 [Neurospora hispaniola]|uniref:Uncharacterized protein n=1 Tax=Neurospora hispaniola TaxID=588809 RepID=A0AAJ0IFM6_9PEZI|nr:hypothetical protein B0T23DRAFT_370036 [Neurospora hispaniola]
MRKREISDTNTKRTSFLCSGSGSGSGSRQTKRKPLTVHVLLSTIDLGPSGPESMLPIYSSKHIIMGASTWLPNCRTLLYSAYLLLIFFNPSYNDAPATT